MDRCECRICGSNEGWSGTKLCDGCWESERRLGDFLQHPKARLQVCKALADADPRFSCLRNIGEKEPIFILRAKDKVAASVVRIWSVLAAKADAPLAKTAHADACATRMDVWGALNGTKVPD